MEQFTDQEGKALSDFIMSLSQRHLTYVWVQLLRNAKLREAIEAWYKDPRYEETTRAIYMAFIAFPEQPAPELPSQ